MIEFGGNSGGGGSSGIEVTDGTHDFTGITKLLLNGGTVSSPETGEAEITVGSVDPYAWVPLTFSATLPAFGAEWPVSDQTFAIADGDYFEAECGIDNVGTNTNGNGIGLITAGNTGLLSYIDQNGNRALGVLSGSGVASVPYYVASGLPGGGGNWALTHGFSAQTSKGVPGACDVGLGSIGNGAQGYFVIGAELAGAGGRCILLNPNGLSDILWARARLIKAGS